MGKKEFKTFLKFLMMVWTLSVPCEKGQRRKAVLKGELKGVHFGPC